MAIKINPAHRGDFTRLAKRHGMSVQAFARHVLAHKDQFSTHVVRMANFAHNAAGFHHSSGGLASRDR